MNRRTLVEAKVTYTLELSGRFYSTEHVPARACRETGEQFFSPGTVERMQALIKEGKQSSRVVEAQRRNQGHRHSRWYEEGP